MNTTDVGNIIGPLTCKHLIEHYTKAIEVDPNMVEAYVNRAIVYTNLGQYELAVEDCNKAIELDPTLPTIYINRAYNYNCMKEYHKAIVDCTNVINNMGSCMAAAFTNF